jgi:hypothetical protein
LMSRSLVPAWPAYCHVVQASRQCCADTLAARWRPHRPSAGPNPSHSPQHRQYQSTDNMHTGVRLTKATQGNHHTCDPPHPTHSPVPGSGL